MPAMEGDIIYQEQRRKLLTSHSQVKGKVAKYGFIQTNANHVHILTDLTLIFLVLTVFMITNTPYMVDEFIRMDKSWFVL